LAVINSARVWQWLGFKTKLDIREILGGKTMREITLKQ